LKHSYRIITTALLCCLLSVTQADVTAPYVGEWTGPIKQRSQSFSVEMVLWQISSGEIMGLTYYPEYRCAGRLRLDSIKRSTLYFTEVIITRGKACISGGTIILSAGPDNKLQWTWRGGSIKATGIVSRHPVSSRTLQLVRQNQSEDAVTSTTQAARQSQTAPVKKTSAQQSTAQTKPQGFTLSELAKHKTNKKQSKPNLELEQGIEAYASKNYQQAYKLFSKLANAGNASAQYSLGVMYARGDGIAQDHSKAVYWYRKAAGQGDAGAQFALASKYTNGKGVVKDYQKAAHWYSKAAKQGHADAQYYLGNMYKQGAGVAKDQNRADHWYQKAAENGNNNAQLTIGNRYFYGKGIKKNQALGVSWYHKAAMQGNALSQLALAQSYYNGEGIKQDYTQAAHWYSKAANQGDDDAQYSLAVMKYNGIGVRKNVKQAARLLLKAVKQNHIKAFYMLGLLHENGEGVTKNTSMAASLYKMALSKGHSSSAIRLGFIEFSKENHRQALKWFETAKKMGDPDKDLDELIKKTRNTVGAKVKIKDIDQQVDQLLKSRHNAANQGDAKAQYQLARAYHKGEGVKKNMNQAVYWYRKAVAQNHSGAQHWLGILYDKGEGVPKETNRATSLYKKAYAQGNSYSAIRLGFIEYYKENYRQALRWFETAKKMGNKEKELDGIIAQARKTIQLKQKNQ